MHTWRQFYTGQRLYLISPMHNCIFYTNLVKCQLWRGYCFPVVYQMVGEIFIPSTPSIQYLTVFCFYSFIFDFHNNLNEAYRIVILIPVSQKKKQRVGEVESKSVCFLLYPNFRGVQGISIMPFVYCTKRYNNKLKLPSFLTYQTFIFQTPSCFWRDSLRCHPSRKAKDDSLLSGPGNQARDVILAKRDFPPRHIDRGSVNGIFQFRFASIELAT